MTITNFVQLLTTRGKLIFSQFSDKDSMKHLLGFLLSYLFAK